MASEDYERPLTAQEAVLAELRRSIRSAQWPPGTAIRQDAVATDLGVSRVPVREALKILEGEGQVSYIPHKGYLVTEFDATELREIYRIRDILEDEAVRVAVPLLSDADLDRMDEAMVAMERTDVADVNGLTEHNRQFHLTLFEAAGMPRLLHFIRVLRDWSDAYRAMVYSDAVTLERTLAEHRVIHEAAARGDAAEVQRLLHHHRARTVDGVSAKMDGQSD